MTVPVKLSEVVDEMDVLMDGGTAYLDRRTGELYTLMHDDAALLEDADDIDPEDFPSWQRDELPKMREVLESEDWHSEDLEVTDQRPLFIVPYET
jgi:hypothetical protein